MKELSAMYRRRKKYLFLPAAIIAALAITGAILLPSRYESSTTILVQRDEILNPLISFEMAVTMASEDRLRTFNEIIYSQTTIQRLIDSLHIGGGALSEDQHQELVTAVKKSIAVDRRGSDSFRLTYTDTDPKRAQHAVELLANIFIETILHVEGQRNENTVQFFENKLDEIRRKFEESQKEVVTQLKQRMDVVPAESRPIYGQIDDIEKRQSDLNARTKLYTQTLTTLSSFPQAIRSDSGRQALFEIQRADLPFAGDLRPLINKYDDYLRRYTAKYPEVQKLEQDIVEVLDRMDKAIQKELVHLESQRLDMEQKHAQLLDQLKESSISQHVDESGESDYGIYRKLYDEMKVKLEQAKTARDLGAKGASQFIILDPALIPIHPTKPNRPLIILGGFAIGIFLGFLTAIMKETFDTTVRAPQDIIVYQKPVIAFITDGSEHHSK